MNNKSEILNAFNNHLDELLTNLIEIFPKEHDLKAAAITLGTLRKANPKLILPIWERNILNKYEENIVTGNVKYFLEKDFTDEAKYLGNEKYVLEKIEIVKKNISVLDDDNLQKVVKYLQNLTELCKVYNS
tara:strand:- start:2740 stop:3132 length:393 start_codon:yes stop_codon:yes gene_type:complete